MITFLEYLAEKEWNESPGIKEPTFKRVPNGLYLGYRVASGVDSRRSNALKKGNKIRFKGKGVFVTNEPQHAIDYYGVHGEGENVLQMVGFDKKDVTFGSLYDGEPEILVKAITIFDMKVF